MILKDKKGNPLEVFVNGEFNDITIEDICYLDSDDDVPEETMQYVYDTYSDELRDAYMDKLMDAANAYNDYERDNYEEN